MPPAASDPPTSQGKERALQPAEDVRYSGAAAKGNRKSRKLRQQKKGRNSAPILLLALREAPNAAATFSLFCLHIRLHSITQSLQVA